MCEREAAPRGIHFAKARMMTIKHLIAGAVVTAAVSTALVLGGAASAQATIFPPPKPIGPGDVTKPIYTQPGLRGFHLPKELWTWYGPQVKPSSRLHPYTVLPTCTTLFEPVFYSELTDAGFALTADHTPRATRDPQLLAQLASAYSVNCDFVNARGSHVDISLAIYVNDAAVSNRLDALGYSAPDALSSRTKVFADGHTEAQDIALGEGGWDLTSWDNSDIPGDIQHAVTSVFQGANIY